MTFILKTRFLVWKGWVCYEQLIEILWGLNYAHENSRPGYITIITMFDQLFRGECYTIQMLLSICQYFLHTSVGPWCLVWGAITFSVLADLSSKLTNSCTSCTFLLVTIGSSTFYFSLSYIVCYCATPIKSLLSLLVCYRCDIWYCFHIGHYTGHCR